MQTHPCNFIQSFISELVQVPYSISVSHWEGPKKKTEANQVPLK